MAFKRRGTGRDEMLKRNQQRAAARRRAKQTKNKSESTKEDLKVGSKETASYMEGVGPYKDGQVYSSALPKTKQKPPSPTPQTKREETPQGNQQREKPPEETTPKEEEKPTNTTVAQHGQYLDSNPELKVQNKTRAVTSSRSQVEERQKAATATLKKILNKLKINLRKSYQAERARY